MASRDRGEELSQLSRLLFGSAAAKWYGAALTEVIVAILAAMIGALELAGDWALIGALIGLVLLFVAYGLRLWFEDQYDAAETMRRQAALTEGLGWPLDTVQSSEWLQKAGKRIRDRLKLRPRDADYYASTASVGAQRLIEMTVESAFYTRHLYDKLRLWVWAIFAGILLLAGVVVLLALTRAVPDSADAVVARVLYAVIPVVVSLNLLGWALRLTRSISTLRQIQADFNRQLSQGENDERQVMRLVSEYNCQVVGGFPIHDRLFQRWHGEIRELWERR